MRQGAATADQQAGPSGQNGSIGGSVDLTFQEAIVQLQEYWTSVGCTLWQPHNTEANTLHREHKHWQDQIFVLIP